MYLDFREVNSYKKREFHDMVEKDGKTVNLKVALKMLS